MHQLIESDRGISITVNGKMKFLRVLNKTPRHAMKM
jgi:hypothetical protein